MNVDFFNALDHSGREYHHVKYVKNRQRQRKLFNLVEKGSSYGDPVMWSGFNNVVVTQT